MENGLEHDNSLNDNGLESVQNATSSTNKSSTDSTDTSKKTSEASEKDDAILLASLGFKGGDGGDSGTPVKGKGMVTADVALKILDNMSKGQAPFKPELGKGGCSWFTIEGNPYVGSIVSADKDIPVEVEVTQPKDAVKFKENDLISIRDEIKQKIKAEHEVEWRKRAKIPANKALNSSQTKNLAHALDRAAESKMWDEVGRRVNSSGSKVGIVELENSIFSKSGNGKFAVVADPSKIQVKGGLPKLIESLKAKMAPNDPVMEEAVRKAAKIKQPSGTVKAIFKYGGKLLVIVGIGVEAYQIFTAEDKLKQTVKSVSGLAGATAASSAFATYASPALSGGPWGWIAYGVGTLAAGGVGYFVASETTEYIYEIIFD